MPGRITGGTRGFLGKIHSAEPSARATSLRQAESKMRSEHGNRNHFPRRKSNDQLRGAAAPVSLMCSEV
jgi:hypothetical protein